MLQIGGTLTDLMPAAYHANLFAHELMRRSPSDSVERFTSNRDGPAEGTSVASVAAICFKGSGSKIDMDSLRDPKEDRPAPNFLCTSAKVLARWSPRIEVRTGLNIPN